MKKNEKEQNICNLLQPKSESTDQRDSDFRYGKIDGVQVIRPGYEKWRVKGRFNYPTISRLNWCPQRQRS